MNHGLTVVITFPVKFLSIDSIFSSMEAKSIVFSHLNSHSQNKIRSLGRANDLYVRADNPCVSFPSLFRKRPDNRRTQQPGTTTVDRRCPRLNRRRKSNQDKGEVPTSLEQVDGILQQLQHHATTRLSLRHRGIL